jgi:iron(III) transport system substrate-binding protein
MNPRRNLLIATALAAAGLAIPVLAQVKANATAADVANYAGADREQKIIEGAKKEGTLDIYTSAQSDDMGALVSAYEKKYGIKVNVWRSSSEKVLQRAVTEARGNRHTVDVCETNGPEMEALSREKLLEKVKSPYLADLIAPALRPHGEWVGTRLNVFVQAYNTQAIKKEELPKTWEDLANPKWKGKLGIEQEDSDWLAGQFAEMGDAHAEKVFRDIVAANGISVRSGHTLLANLVVSGEVPFALTTYTFRVEQLKKSGAPVDWVAIPPTIARFEGAAVARRAPHPHAAILFFEFLLTEAQELLRDREMFTARRAAAPLPGGMSLAFLDAARSLDESRKWGRYYREIIVGQAR